jgi:hypothetical protein
VRGPERSLPIGDEQGRTIARAATCIRRDASTEYHLAPALPRRGLTRRLRAGDRIAVRVTNNNQDSWMFAAPSVQSGTVRGGSITLPFLTYLRTQTIQGDPGVQLADYLAQQTASAPADALSGGVDLNLPTQLENLRDGSVYTGGYTEPVGGP